MPLRILTSQGRAFIASWEHCSLTPYRDSAGIWTIGYGHTQGVSADSPAISLTDADSLLLGDLAAAEGEVVRLIHASLNDNQYAALVSIAFNAGTAPLLGHLGYYVNQIQMDRAADEFGKWIHADGQIVAGLVRRRAAERALFLTPVS